MLRRLTVIAFTLAVGILIGVIIGPGLSVLYWKSVLDCSHSNGSRLRASQQLASTDRGKAVLWERMTSSNAELRSAATWGLVQAHTNDSNYLVNLWFHVPETATDEKIAASDALVVSAARYADIAEYLRYEHEHTENDCLRANMLKDLHELDTVALSVHEELTGRPRWYTREHSVKPTLPRH